MLLNATSLRLYIFAQSALIQKSALIFFDQQEKKPQNKQRATQH